ncbi:MAG: hypothetical protein ABI675_13585 [Chitinophagaceae bacterium]
MNARLMVDQSNELQEFRETGYRPGNPLIKLVAKAISYIFHPLFVPVYMIIFLLYIHPFEFAGTSSWDKKMVLLQTILMYGFFPLITVLLLKALDFIESIYLNKQKDRIIPFVICNIWYFWIWYVWRNLPNSPKEIVVLAMAIFLASAIGLMANIYMKISMHTIAMGVAISFMLFLAVTQSISFGVYASIAFLIAGLVCTARFIVSDHTSGEIYTGLLVGVFSQLIAIWVGGIFP